MKRNIISRKNILVGIFSILSTFSISFSYSQSPYDILGTVVQAGEEDAIAFIGNYMKPLGKAWGSDLSCGWYNTAQTHEIGGFDLTFGLHYAKVPDIDKTFDLGNTGLQKIQSTDGDNIAPTVLNANETANINIILDNNQLLLAEDIEMKGFDISGSVPLPTFQIGLGIIKNTEIMGRLIPNTSLSDFGNINLWGFGIKHNFYQWLPIVDDFPLDASILFAYSKVKLNFGLDYTPAADDDFINVILPEDQKMEMKISAWTANLIISKKILFVTPYVSAGITNTNFNMELLGTYYFAIPNEDGILEINDDDAYRIDGGININPEIELDTQFTAGLRVKFMVFTISAQYTMQEYNTFSAGFGLSFH